MKRTTTYRLPNPQEIPLPGGFVSLIEDNCKAYKMGACNIIIGHSAEAGWHMSVSHPKRNPFWEEIAHARYKLLPADKLFAMYLPPEEDYVNIHEYCFHLFEEKYECWRKIVRAAVRVDAWNQGELDGVNGDDLAGELHEAIVELRETR